MTTKTERRLLNSAAAHAMHAKHDTAVVSAKGRQVADARLNARLLAEVDETTPGLDDAARQLALYHKRMQHFKALAAKGAGKSHKPPRKLPVLP